jgi:hypothetical protein
MLNKKLNILKMGDEYGWAWYFIAKNQFKYSKHSIIYKRAKDIDIDSFQDIDIVYYHSPFLQDKKLIEQIKEKYPNIKIIGGRGEEQIELTYHYADIIICNSIKFLSYLKKQNSVPVIFAPQGVDINYFSPIENMSKELIAGYSGSNYAVKRTHLLNSLNYQIKKYQKQDRKSVG